MKKADILKHNQAAWDKAVQENDRWTVPVDSAEIEAARRGEFSVLLTDTLPVPQAWFPILEDADVLCLASGGGQQGPILAAAGANVTVVDYSAEQLAQDDAVAARENLPLTTIQADMANLSMLEDASFDLIFHPISNCFSSVVRPVWHEAYRVLRPGGVLLSGFMNPAVYIFDPELLKTSGDLKVRYSLPYADVDFRDGEVVNAKVINGEPLEFSHTLADQIGGQLAAGFMLTGFYEDSQPDDPISQFMSTRIATRAVKPVL